MKKFVALAAVIGLLGCASVLQAQVTPADLVLQIDQAGNGYLVNETAGAVSFDGYSITDDPAARLNPANYTSIQDAVAADAVAVIAKLGSGALAFGEVPTIGPALVAELNLAGVATLQAGDTWGLGQIFPAGLTPGRGAQLGGMGFSFSGGGVVVNPPDANIEVVPEPSSLILAGIALLGMVGYIRRRK